jgi:hypothetical protein
MRWLWLIIGVLAVAAGVIWTLQGLNILGGSAMSGHTIFAVIGPVVAVVGLVLVGVSVGRRRAPSA